MPTIREVERAPRSTSDEVVDNEYTDLVLEMEKIETERQAIPVGPKRPKRQEAVIEQDELPKGTEVKDVRRAINATARTHGVSLNFKSTKEEWPIVFGVAIARASEDDEETSEEPQGKAA